MAHFVGLDASVKIVIQAGAQTINDLVGNLDIPRMKQTGHVSWFNEGDTIAFSDEQFDRVSFRPKHCGSIISYSRNMLLQSTPSIEMIIRDDLSRLLAPDTPSATPSRTRPFRYVRMRCAPTGSGEGFCPFTSRSQGKAYPSDRLGFQVTRAYLVQASINARPNGVRLTTRTEA